MKAKKIDWKESHTDFLTGSIGKTPFCVIDERNGMFTLRTFLYGTVQFYRAYPEVGKVKAMARKKLREHIKHLQKSLLLYATEK